MSNLTPLFIAMLMLVMLSTAFSLWSPRKLSLKIAALAVGLSTLPVVYASFADLLSRPKPSNHEWWLRNVEEVVVLASQVDRSAGIHLWLLFPGIPEPRAYTVPWNKDLAEELQSAKRESERTSGEVRMRLPFEPSLEDRRPKFYAQPQPSMPSKDHSLEPPTWLEHERNPGQAT